MKRTIIAVAVSFGIVLSGGTLALASASTCTTTQHTVKSGTTTTQDSLKVCTLANGGWSRTQSHKVSTTTPSGTVGSARTVITGHYVSKSGTASDRTSVRTCTKPAGTVENCTTTVTTV
jgi:hypothetical protein